jgi:16S rRNA (guanine527-N7)-methyltransferase
MNHEMDVSRETFDWARDWESRLRERVAAVGSGSGDHELNGLVVFARLVLERNQRLHLVSQRHPEREVVKQIVDSAAALSVLNVPARCRLLDVGSGAGIPGMIFKIMRPDLNLISLDSSPKKIEFQAHACGQLSLSAEFCQADFRRAEVDPKVDLVIVKALGLHREIVRKASAWLLSEGRLIFMEGRTPNPEIQASIKRSKSFSKVAETLRYSLTGFAGERHLVVLAKS